VDNALLISLVVVVISQFGLLWYKLGKIEQCLKNHLVSDNKAKEAK